MPRLKTRIWSTLALFFLGWLLHPAQATAQTSWKGTTSTAWSNAANWTSGVPTASVDAIIGDASFTGASQPTVDATATAKSLTLGTGSKASTLTLTTLNLTVSGAVTIGSNGTLNHSSSAILSLSGDWSNSGSYTSGGSAAVSLTGAAKSIGGSSSTAFPALTIASGASYTLNTDATAASLTLPVSATATSLTHASGIDLTVNGNITINQPSASVTEAWNVNDGTAHVTGTVSLGGTNTTAARIAKIAVTGGSLTLDGTVTYAVNNTAANRVITTATGTVTFGSALTLNSGTLSLTASGGSVNLNGGLAFGGSSTPVLSTVSGSILNVGGDLSAATTALALNAGSTEVFTGNSTVTPTAAITFGNVQLNSGVTVTLAGNITAAGDWTNNGGTLSGGSNTVTFSGASKAIGGTAGTDFPNFTIAPAASYTMNTSSSCSSLTFTASGTASSLTHGGTSALTVNGAVTLNQPTASVATAWNLNAGSATVSGLISFAGSNTGASRVSKIVLTTGTLNANGGITFVGSAAATKVIDMSGGAGTLNLKGALTVPAVSSTLTAGTSGSIFNYADNVAQTVNFFSAGAYHNLHANNTHASGATLSAAITTSNVTGNLRVLSGTFDNGGFAIAGTTGKTLEVVNGATLKLSGTTSAFPTGFSTLTLGATSTVHYSGTGAQTVAAQNYGHLTVSAARAANNLTLTSSGTIGVAGTLTASATFSGGNGFVTTGSTVEYNGAGSQAVTTLAPLVAGNSGYNGLKINNASGVSLSADVTVGGTLTLAAGNVTTGANKLILSSSGSVSRTSGHIVGKLEKNVATGSPSRTFEVGDGSNYTPVSLAFASVTVAGDLIASTAVGDHASILTSTISSTRGVNRNWTLTNSGISFTTTSATFTFVAGDLDAGASTSAFAVGRYAASAWTAPTVGTKTSTSTQATGLTAFGDFAVGETVTANMTIANDRTPTGNQPPGTDLVHALTLTNTGVGWAESLVVVDSLLGNTDFKVGSITSSLGSSGLSVAVAYSNDSGTSWTYVPASGAGGAPAGYDRNVNRIKWTFTGNLSPTPPDNTGAVGFTVRIR